MGNSRRMQMKKAGERPVPTMSDTDIMGDFVSEIRPALHRFRDWAYPDQIDHALYSAYMKQPHDVGGEPDAPVIFEEKEEEQWELNTFVDCEVLGWRGIWTSEERRRIANVDIGRTMYGGFPYYGRWLWSIVRILMEKQYVTLGEVVERVHSVQKRAAGRTTQNPLEAEPRLTGDKKNVERNHHHKDAIGKGDPQCFNGMAGKARFSVGDEVRVRELPSILYSRTQEYLRGAPGTITRVTYESLAPEDEAFNREDEKPEWFYIVRFKMTDLWKSYAGPPQDTLQAEIVERWLEPRSA
jgi:hypothetical protein